MKNQQASKSARSIAARQSTPHWWLLLGSILLAALVLLGLSGCASQPAAVAEPAAGETLPANISVDQAHQLYEDGTFVLDVRTQEEWNDFHIPNTTLIPLDELESRLSEVPADQPIVVICRSGNRSQVGRDTLKQAGYENVTSVDGGVTAWDSAGYPIEP
ncbi:MAG: rhodanese-like domain-containing protein [Anaerolineales bacterium]|jgi:rhodanese-related sulfurtransferase